MTDQVSSISDVFTFEPSPWGHSYAVNINDWIHSGFMDPLTERGIQQILVEVVPGETVPLHVEKTLTDPSNSCVLAPRLGPGREIHFWYGKTPSGANIKVFPSVKAQ